MELVPDANTRRHQGKAECRPPCVEAAEDISEQVTIVTSNVDPLHQLAGSKQVFQLHGDILETLCTNCRGVDDLEMEFVEHDVTEETLPRCQCNGLLRPNVVWFG